MRRAPFFRTVWDDRGTLPAEPCGFFRLEKTSGGEPLNRLAIPFGGCIRMPPGIETTRRLRQTREIDRLRKREVFRLFFKINACRGGRANQSIAVMIAIEILLEDLVLRPGALKPQGRNILVELRAPAPTAAAGGERGGN